MLTSAGSGMLTSAVSPLSSDPAGATFSDTFSLAIFLEDAGILGQTGAGFLGLETSGGSGLETEGFGSEVVVLCGALVCTP
jgi:hypothetical protein